jgi:cation/acetate symporter
MPLDGQDTQSELSRTSAGRGAFALMALLFTLAVVLLVACAASVAWADGGYWVIAIAAAGAVSLAAGLRFFGGASSPVIGGLSLAINILTGAFFLAIPGAIFAAGQDGLAYALGLGAGGMLMQLVIAPRFAQSGARSLPDLLRMRFPGRAVEFLGLVITTASMVMLLAAGLIAAGLVGMRLLGVDFTSATLAAGCAAFACFIVRGNGRSSVVDGLFYPLLFAALFVPLLIVSAQWYGLPVPEVAYANSLWQLQGIEENLLEQDLADPGFMKPMLTPFLTLTPLNFAGIVLALAAGIAVLPSLLFPPLSSTTARNARHTAFWGLGFAALLLTLAPAVATFVRQSIATLIADRTPLAELPQWIFIYGKLGLVQICGHAARNAAEVAQACAALPDASSVLHLQDLVVDPDIVTLAMPEILGLDVALMGFIAVATLSTVLATAHASLSAVVQGLGLEIEGATAGTARGARLASYVIAASVIAASAVIALQRPVGIVELATASIVLAAAGLFPAVVAALWWPRVNSWGATAGMLAGLGAMFLYFAGRHYFPVPFFELSARLSSGGEPGLQYFNELKDAWLTAEPGAAADAAWVTLTVQARTVADWWGIGGPATVLLALPVGFLALALVSLLTRAPRRPETVP